MNASIDSTNAVAAVATTATARAPDREDRRTVEPTQDSQLRAGEDDRQQTPVLQLVRRSAESFSELLEVLKNAESAAALSGTPPTGVAKGVVVDTYA